MNPAYSAVESKPAVQSLGNWPLILQMRVKKVKMFTQSCPTLCDPRLLCPWNSPGKNPGIVEFRSPGDLPNPGIKPRSPSFQADSLPSEPPGKPKVKVQVLVAHTCQTLCNPMGCSPPGSPVHGVLQARILEWIAIPFSRGSPQPRDQTWVF